MSTFIFLGPSLPVSEASYLLPATYLPPVQQGDILRLLPRKPRIIGIVDGYFETVPAVWHKEILFALEMGVRVFGAASIGALRAAELCRFGMIGVGRIFEWYRDGVITGDDEVAITHAPGELHFQPLSDALTDIRDACAAAEAAGVISAACAVCLIDTARALPFAERSYESVARAASANGHAAEAGAWLHLCRSRGPGLKQRDALALIAAVASAEREERPPQYQPVAVERTTFFEHLKMEVEAGAAFGAAERSLLRDARKTMLLRLLARDAAERFGWTLDPHEVSEYGSRLLHARGLSQLEQWPTSKSDTSAEESFWRFVNDSLLIQKLDQLFTFEIECELIDCVHATRHEAK
jgi:hypothetical protein